MAKIFTSINTGLIGGRYGSYVVEDGMLITGQNPACSELIEAGNVWQ